MVWDRTIQPDPQTYKSYCWFIYSVPRYTVRAMFPPAGREDTYGGKTETEIRSLAFERLSELERRHGTVEVEMIGDKHENFN